MLQQSTIQVLASLQWHSLVGRCSWAWLLPLTLHRPLQELFVFDYLPQALSWEPVRMLLLWNSPVELKEVRRQEGLQVRRRAAFAEQHWPKL